MFLHNITNRFALLAMITLLTCTGCGAFGDAAFQTGEAGLRTLVDLLLTEFANNTLDAIGDDDATDEGDDTGDNGDDNGDEDGDTDDGDDGDTDDGETGGDTGGGTDDAVTRGEQILADNCAACHGADGASGFAPNIQGQTAEVITATIGGEGGHSVYELTADQIADLTAYLNSF
ncbi:MAG: hypothetical protein HJJLKODD_00610 [Phycisphaerae bacterium]|nr:hypothetical protein [Phycisphaerae bacterium]